MNAMINGSGTTDNTETIRDLEEGEHPSRSLTSPPQKAQQQQTSLHKKAQMDINTASGFSTFAAGSTATKPMKVTKDQSDKNNKVGGGGGDALLSSEMESSDSSSTGSSGGRRSLHGAFFSQRKIIFATLIFVVGAFASGAFLSIGILNAKDDQTSQFERLADEFVVKLQAAFSDYELFGLWIHESCRDRGWLSNNNNNHSAEDVDNVLGICSRQEFRDLYEYILSVGLDFQSAQFMPYVPHDKREMVEAQAHAYYQANYDHVNYRGIVGLFFDDEGVKVLPQEEKEYYWPVHYIEPVVGNEAAIELDLYSSPTQRRNIEHSIETWKPSVTDRLRLVQETDPSAYSIILHHPGIRLTTHNETDTPTGVALMVIRIPALLARTNSNGTESASFYIYDSTHDDDEADPVFLGAHTVYHQSDDTVLFHGLPEISLEELEATVITRLEVRQVAIADRTWTIAVVSLPNTYEPEIVFVLVGGVIIFMASLILSTCFWAHMTRVSKLNAIKAQAAQEKAEIIVDTARQQALAERQLNEYIAHEVRNPLSSAIAALSFVSAASKEPQQTEEEKQVMRDDLKIIDASLQFINELLRNMLDMHRAANQQMKITMAPTDLLRDVLEPVASILHMRGNKVEIITECPPNIVVMSDRLRLKQIVLNLAVNSTKFVEKGFIKLKCVVEEDHSGQSVQIYLEDSGPGIPLDKRKNLFKKFQESLDLLNQGTGIGLCLCKHLTNLMKGDLWLDEDYDSGIEGCPGTRFILDLHSPPLSEDYWDNENQSLLEYDKLHPRQSTGNDGSSNPSTPPQVSASTSSSLSGGQTKDVSPSNSITASSAIGAQPIAEQHNAAQQQLQQPTTTSTHFNQDSHPPPSPHHHNSPGRQLPEKLRVLFCDDDMVLRKLFVRSLKRVAPGWDVQEAANGETAIHIVQKDPNAFEVIFLDQYMSSIDKQLLGTETARELRAKGVTCRICGLSANDAETAFLDAGADCFLFKPFPCEKEALKRALLGVLFAPSRRSCRNTAAAAATEQRESEKGQDHIPPHNQAPPPPPLVEKDIV